MTDRDSLGFCCRGRRRRGPREPAGFTILEVLVAALLLLLGALALAQSYSYARAWQGVALHRAQASSLAAQEIEDLARQGYAAVPLGNQPPQAISLEGGGSYPGQLYVSVALRNFGGGVQVKEVTVEVRWTEPLLFGNPTERVELVTFLADLSSF